MLIKGMIHNFKSIISFIYTDNFYNLVSKSLILFYNNLFSFFKVSLNFIYKSILLFNVLL